jgi:hypothetical protein
MRSTFAAIAAVLVACSLLRYRELFDRSALDLMTFALACALVSAFLRPDAFAGAGIRRFDFGGAATLLVSVVAILGGVSSLARYGPETPPYPLTARVLIAFAVCCVFSYALPVHPRFVRVRLPAMLVMACLGTWIAATAGGPPKIDVWWWQQLGGAHVLGGRNPYSEIYPNIYENDRFYGPGVLGPSGVRIFPYPPLTVILDAAFVFVFGDIRAGMLLALGVTAWLVTRVTPGTAGEIAGAALLLHPRTIYVLERGWTEPIVLAALVASIALIARLRDRGGSAWPAGCALALAAASKQYAPLLVVPLLPAIPRKRLLGVALCACAVLVVTLAPFVAWNWREFAFDVIESHFRQPFRGDSLSWLVPISARRGETVSAAPGFVAALLTLLALRRAVSLSRATCVAAATMLAFFLFNKQAFTNYFWLAGGLLVIAAVLDDAGSPST